MARELKVTTFNVEWMVNLFENGKPVLLTKHNPRSPGLGSKPKDPQGVATRIANVIKDIDPDILGICEGPPLKSQMETFVKRHLGGAYRVFSMEDGPQSVHGLVHRRLAGALAVSQLDRKDKVFGRLDQVRKYYKFGNVRTEEKARFTRLPVILKLAHKKKTTELMIVHTKSKISELKKAKDWEKKKASAIVSAIQSRQKLSLEMNVIRKYIAHGLYSERTDGVIVMGDLNDGITRDLVDDTYLQHSIVHELRGAFQHEIALMKHALSPEQLQKKADGWTVEFKDATNQGKPTRVLLDHILYSPKLEQGGTIQFVEGSGAIEHAVMEKHTAVKHRTRVDRPSDHRPMTARFVLR